MIFNIFLQILDDGRVTDSQGRTVDFKNTIIILTSNLGAQLILDSIAKTGEITEEAKDQIRLVLRNQFRPEFLNRLDETIFFQALAKDQVYNIVRLLLKGLIGRLEEQEITMTVSDDVVNWVVEEGYDINFGARPLKRTIQDEIETMVSRAIIADEIKKKDVIEIIVDNNNELSIKKVSKASNSVK